MNKEMPNEEPEHKNSREFSPAQELINNFPYMAMIALGTAIFVLGFGSLKWELITGSAYLAYGAAGAFWIMIFVCPYCRYWNTRLCPCGYGRIAAKLRGKKTADCFDDKFKKHIPVIVPLWFLPMLAGVPLIIRSFSWTLLALLIVFVLNAFVVLPLASIKHGCKECPQKDSCPWIRYRSKPAAGSA